MTYATQAQMIDRFGESALVALTDRGEVAHEVIDVGVLTAALTAADAVIDGYLAARYALPLSPIPPVITDLAQVIAIWKLNTSEPDPKVKADYEAAMRLLRDISTGAFRIPAAGVEPAALGGSGARITDRERPLTADNLKGFI